MPTGRPRAQWPAELPVRTPTRDLNRQLGTRKTGFSVTTHPASASPSFFSPFLYFEPANGRSSGPKPGWSLSSELPLPHITPHHPLPLHAVRSGRPKRHRAHPDLPAHLTSAVNRPPPRWGLTGWSWCQILTCCVASRRPNFARSRPRYFLLRLHALVVRARAPTVTSSPPALPYLSCVGVDGF